MVYKCNQILPQEKILKLKGIHVQILKNIIINNKTLNMNDETKIQIKNLNEHLRMKQY